jgi:hypothetical protein
MSLNLFSSQTERKSGDNKHLVKNVNSVRRHGMGLKECTGSFSVLSSTVKYWHDFRVTINAVWVVNRLY